MALFTIGYFVSILWFIVSFHDLYKNTRVYCRVRNIYPLPRFTLTLKNTLVFLICATFPILNAALCIPLCLMTPEEAAKRILEKRREKGNPYEA